MQIEVAAFLTGLVDLAGFMLDSPEHWILELGIKERAKRKHMAFETKLPL